METTRATTAAKLTASSQLVDSSNGFEGFSLSLTLDQIVVVALRAAQTDRAAQTQTTRRHVSCRLMPEIYSGNTAAQSLAMLITVQPRSAATSTIGLPSSKLTASLS